MREMQNGRWRSHVYKRQFFKFAMTIQRVRNNFTASDYRRFEKGFLLLEAIFIPKGQTPKQNKWNRNRIFKKKIRCNIYREYTRTQFVQMLPKMLITKSEGTSLHPGVTQRDSLPVLSTKSNPTYCHTLVKRRHFTRLPVTPHIHTTPTLRRELSVQSAEELVVFFRLGNSF